MAGCSFSQLDSIWTHIKREMSGKVSIRPSIADVKSGTVQLVTVTFSKFEDLLSTLVSVDAQALWSTLVRTKVDGGSGKVVAMRIIRCLLVSEDGDRLSIVMTVGHGLADGRCMDSTLRVPHRANTV